MIYDKEKKHAQSAGFEPARAEPNGFLVHRLNHSATTAAVDSSGPVCGFVQSHPIFLQSENVTLSTGFEPVREYPNGFQVHRLNHSATTAGGVEP